MNLMQQILTQNDCYKAGRYITPKGVMVHSTGANNPRLRRYVPGNDVIGRNTGGNHWNMSGVGACVHGFIGKLANGNIATVQTLPWNMRGWHAASGKNGSANNTHISFEICEDDLADSVYFSKVYLEAVELTAMLCKQYKLNPMADGVVICHSEGYRRGIASNHADVMHWFPKHGKNMDIFRADVLREMEGDDMTQEQFNGMMNTYLNQLAQQEPGDWSAEQRQWAESIGLIAGDGSGKMQYKMFTTREQMVVFMRRLYELVKK